LESPSFGLLFSLVSSVVCCFAFLNGLTQIFHVLSGRQVAFLFFLFFFYSAAMVSLSNFQGSNISPCF